MAKNNEVIIIAQIWFIILQSFVCKNALNAISSPNAKMSNCGVSLIPIYQMSKYVLYVPQHANRNPA